MELILKLKDDSKLDSLIVALRQFIASEGVDVTLESEERGVILESPKNDYDWDRLREILDRSKLRPGQPEMPPQEEEEWIAQQVKAGRAEECISAKTVTLSLAKQEETAAPLTAREYEHYGIFENDPEAMKLFDEIEEERNKHIVEPLSS
ncbi:MAG: hypothetical protein L0229_17545 [Blastocatellia bacterium]|nr:hypothetical protein [Blastocatellia bacterium]